jgi:hypothetical protein
MSENLFFVLQDKGAEEDTAGSHETGGQVLRGSSQVSLSVSRRYGIEPKQGTNCFFCSLTF